MFFIKLLTNDVGALVSLGPEKELGNVLLLTLLEELSPSLLLVVLVDLIPLILLTDICNSFAIYSLFLLIS